MLRQLKYFVSAYFRLETLRGASYSAERNIFRILSPTEIFARRDRSREN